MNRNSFNLHRRNRNFGYDKVLMLAIVIAGSFTAASGVSGQSRVRFGPDQVVRFKATAPATAVNRVPAPAIGQNRDLLKNAGNAAVNKRIAIHAAQRGNVAVNAGYAALKNRETLKKLRQAAKTTKNLRRGIIAGTGVGVVFVGGMWIAESLLGDSPDDIAIDSFIALAQGKRVDHVLAQVGKRLDPVRLANNMKRNLDKTGRDISNAFNSVGRELGKIRL